MATTFNLYQPTNPIAIPYEDGDELVHIAPWFTCSDPQCPCHEGNLHVLSEDDELAALPSYEAASKPMPLDYEALSAAWDETARADLLSEYRALGQDRNTTTQTQSGEWW